MAQPPLTYNSFSNLPPGSPPPPPPARAALPPPPPQPESPPAEQPADAGRSPEPVVPAAPPAATVQVVESVPAAPPARPDRRRWPVVGGVLGLAAGLGLGLAYHDRLPAETVAAPADPPATAVKPGPAPAPDPEVKRLEEGVATRDARVKQLDGVLARREADAKAAATRLPAARADLDRVRQRLAALDRAATVAPPPRPRSPEAAADDAEVVALKAKKTELGQRLGPQHRDMLALDEQIKAAERRAAAARPKTPEPAPEQDRRAAQAERDALAEQVASLDQTIERDEAAVATAEKLLAERERTAAERERIAAALADLSAKQAGAMVKPPAPPAATPTEPAPAPAAVTGKPPAWRSLLPGGLGGLALGAALGYLLSRLVPVAAYRTARTPAAPRPAKPAGEAVTAKRAARPAARGAAAEDAAAFGMPVLAHVPAIQADQPPEKRSGDGFGPSLVSFFRPSSPEGVAFQTARRNLTAVLANRGHVVVLVTGPGPGDGKTTTAANLAVSLARAGKRVILVDCDLRSPGVQGVFNLGRLGDGLRGVMTADVDLRLAVRSCEVGNLFLLPAGRGSADPADLLSRPKFRELIADLRAGYEYVLLDGPPATAEKELAALAEYPDGAVLAVRAGADAVTRAEWGRGQLTAAGVKLLGAVVNVTTAVPDEATPAPGKAAAHA